jgi:hypothetical protein
MCLFKKKPISSSFASPERVRAFSFERVPATLGEFQALYERDKSDPFASASLVALAFLAYRKDPELCFFCLALLKAPESLSPIERSFIRDRLNEGKDYKPYSYFTGALPSNDYTPSHPLMVVVKENPQSFLEEGYATLYLTSSGASSPRPLRLRKRNDGSWALQEEFLLADIVSPHKENPWA